MDSTQIVEVVSNLGAAGVLIYLVLYVFRTWLPKERAMHQKAMDRCRSDFAKSLDKQRVDFRTELKSSRETLSVQTKAFTKSISEQREDFRKTLQIIVPSLGAHGDDTLA